MEFGTVSYFGEVEAPDALSPFPVFLVFLVMDGFHIDVTADGSWFGGESSLEGGTSSGLSLEFAFHEGDCSELGFPVMVMFVVDTKESVWESEKFNLSGSHDFFGGLIGVQSIHEFHDLLGSGIGLELE